MIFTLSETTVHQKNIFQINKQKSRHEPSHHPALCPVPPVIQGTSCSTQARTGPRPGADPVLADIVARLKSGRDCMPVVEHDHPRPVQTGAECDLYDPFSRYHNQRPQSLPPVGQMPSNRLSSQPRVDKYTTSHTCICQRPRQLVMCQHCGETFEGRVKRTCSTHPSVTYLLDVVACRGRKMGNIEALKEFPVMNKK